MSLGGTSSECRLAKKIPPYQWQADTNYCFFDVQYLVFYHIAIKNASRWRKEVIMSQENIVNYIDNCVLNSTYSSRSSWYVGITCDPDQCLFEDHNVDKRSLSEWLCVKALNSDAARVAEQALIDLGYDGGTGGGDDSSRFVYAFHKTSSTVR